MSQEDHIFLPSIFRCLSFTISIFILSCLTIFDSIIHKHKFNINSMVMLLKGAASIDQLDLATGALIGVVTYDKIDVNSLKIARYKAGHNFFRTNSSAFICVS